MKPSVQLRLGQNLTMTPQLQQAIRLLQLSTLELQVQIQEALETNPMLEALEGEEAQVEAGEDATDAAPNGEGGHEHSSIEDAAPAEERSGADDIPEELPVDSNWEDIYDVTPFSGSGGAAEADGRDLFENQSSGGESLREHLMWQLNLIPMSAEDRAIAMSLVDAINEDGYLSESLESIQASLSDDMDGELPLEEIEAVLHLVQQLDPAGSGARDLSECLLIQLHQLPADTPWLDEAKRLVRDHLESLGSHDYRQLMRALRVSESELQEIVALIQGLNPRPGGLISNESPEYVIPDVFVRKHEGRWQVELNPDIAPRLRINPLYASFVRRADTSQDNVYMRNHLQEARWFIKSLQSRNETLLRVATAIVEQQRGFLEHGEEAMKPLVLRDIAEQLDMHESTISRVTTQKYMHTPRGIFEFKYFFSSHVGTADGGECSATAIRAMIRKLISEEPAGKPMSDSKIAAILVDRGIHVARRTVAKYREAMAIPPSNERKRLI
ncbi:RNA polymerase factor sigma-54 [Thioalkalivibrio denitrificans]|uniref:RNA polymerase sigma-54 factor n=1 Tax=Thioalkalivibrio denitrificans TaxID=108003 RepID=A0A1V3NSV9_9GAMM|nr:RNA polymerase factor sigma-54 [Thioalkalivibrio denitrificans]